MQSMNLCVIFRRGKCPIYQIGLSKHSTHHSTILFERGSDLSSKRVQHPLSQKMVMLPVFSVLKAMDLQYKAFKKKSLMFWIQMLDPNVMTVMSHFEILIIVCMGLIYDQNNEKAF